MEFTITKAEYDHLKSIEFSYSLLRASVVQSAKYEKYSVNKLNIEFDSNVLINAICLHNALLFDHILEKVKSTKEEQ